MTLFHIIGDKPFPGLFTVIFLSAILMQSSFFLMESNPWQLQAFLIILYVLVVNATIFGFNLFLMATQSLRGSTVSGGFISGLTISLFTFIFITYHLYSTKVKKLLICFTFHDTNYT